jgi:hypothetical protein
MCVYQNRFLSLNDDDHFKFFDDMSILLFFHLAKS